MANEKEITREQRFSARISDDASEVIQEIRAELKRRKFKESDGQALEYMAAFVRLAQERYGIDPTTLIKSVLDHSGRIR